MAFYHAVLAGSLHAAVMLAGDTGTVLVRLPQEFAELSDSGMDEEVCKVFKVYGSLTVRNALSAFWAEAVGGRGRGRRSCILSAAL